MVFFQKRNSSRCCPGHMERSFYNSVEKLSMKSREFSANFTVMIDRRRETFRRTFLLKIFLWTRRMQFWPHNRTNLIQSWKLFLLVSEIDWKFSQKNSSQNVAMETKKNAVLTKQLSISLRKSSKSFSQFPKKTEKKFQKIFFLKIFLLTRRMQFWQRCRSLYKERNFFSMSEKEKKSF